MISTLKWNLLRNHNEFIIYANFNNWFSSLIILYLIVFLAETSDVEVDELQPVQNLTRKEGKRPGILLRYRPPNSDSGSIKVYPGKFRWVYICIYKEILSLTFLFIGEIFITKINSSKINQLQKGKL